MVVANARLVPGATLRTVEDFMPKERHGQTAADHLKMFEAITALYGGTDERKKGTGV
jgi:hypothetical protein